MGTFTEPNPPDWNEASWKQLHSKLELELAVVYYVRVKGWENHRNKTRMEVLLFFRIKDGQILDNVWYFVLILALHHGNDSSMEISTQCKIRTFRNQNWTGTTRDARACLRTWIFDLEGAFECPIPTSYLVGLSVCRVTDLFVHLFFKILLQSPVGPGMVLETATQELPIHHCWQHHRHENSLSWPQGGDAQLQQILFIGPN